MNINFYINFDLSIRGDYKGLYKWLDKNNAEERGNGYALIKGYHFPDSKMSGLTEMGEKNNAFAVHLRSEIKEFASINKSDRIYLTMGIIGGDKIGGIFLFGRKQASPWEGSYLDDISTDIDFDF